MLFKLPMFCLRTFYVCVCCIYVCLHGCVRLSDYCAWWWTDCARSPGTCGHSSTAWEDDSLLPWDAAEVHAGECTATISECIGMSVQVQWWFFWSQVPGAWVKQTFLALLLCALVLLWLFFLGGTYPPCNKVEPNEQGKGTAGQQAEVGAMCSSQTYLCWWGCWHSADLGLKHYCASSTSMLDVLSNFGLCPSVAILLSVIITDISWWSYQANPKWRKVGWHDVSVDLKSLLLTLSGSPVVNKRKVVRIVAFLPCTSCYSSYQIENTSLFWIIWLTSIEILHHLCLPVWVGIASSQAVWEICQKTVYKKYLPWVRHCNFAAVCCGIVQL